MVRTLSLSGGCQKCYHSYNDGTGNKICKPYHIAGWLDVSSGFGIDGKGTLYITMGDYCRSGIIRYDDNGKYTTLPFSMFGYETFREGCIPVPDTARIILLHEYNARNNSEYGWNLDCLISIWRHEDAVSLRCTTLGMVYSDCTYFRKTGFW